MTARICECGGSSGGHSDGFGVLISARNQARERSGSVSPPPPVRRLVDGTQPQYRFTVHDSLDDALAAMPSP